MWRISQEPAALAMQSNWIERCTVGKAPWTPKQRLGRPLDGELLLKCNQEQSEQPEGYRSTATRLGGQGYCGLDLVVPHGDLF